MIGGIVNDKLEATVPIRVVGPNGLFQEIISVIDTGYNGTITLSISVVSDLSLPRGSSRSVTLGDLSRKAFDYHTVEILWDGELRKERVLCIEGDPLIGTTLLQGYKLEIDFHVGGPVKLSARAD